MIWLKRIKFNSLFYRTFFLLMILSLIMSILFFVVVNHFVYSNIDRTMREEYQQKLSFSVRNTDNILSNVKNVLTQMSNEPYIINAGIIPGIDSTDNYERNVEVLSILENFKDYNDEIKNIYLLENKAEEVYYSDGEVYKTSKILHLNAVDIDRLLKNGVKIYDAEYGDVFVSVYGDKIFMYMNFLYSVKQPLSTLVFEIDKKILFRNFMYGTYKNFYIFDEKNNELIFSGDEENFSEIKEYAGNFKDADALWNDDCIFVKSNISGWIFSSKYIQEDIKLNMAQIFISILPMLAFFWLLSFILSSFISKSIYKPINSIISNISEKGGASERFDSYKNDIEFLKSEYEASAAKEKEINDIIKNLSSEITERYVKEMLLGKQMDIEEIQKVLHDFKSGLKLNGKYFVLVVRFDEKFLLDRNNENYVSNIKNTVIEFAAGKNAVCISLWQDGGLVFVVETDMEKKDILVWLKYIKTKLSQITVNWPGKVIIGKSLVYDSFYNIYYAYNDALRDTEIQNDTKENEKTGNYMDDFKIKIRYFIDELNDGNFKKADSLIAEIIESITDRAKSDEERNEICNEISREAAKFSSENNIEIDNNIYQKLKNIFKYEESDNLRDILYKHYNSFIERYKCVFNNRQNKYIVQAKNFIKQNYQNSSLSLSDVADYVDINKSYLSTLFNEKMNISVTEYTNGIRIKAAQDMLNNTELSIKEISVKSGFNTVQNFIKVFKKHVGMTPGQYRRNK